MAACERISLTPEREELPVAAEAVQGDVEEGSEYSVDGGGDGEMHVEPRFGLGHKDAPGEHEDGLVKDKEGDGEGEARGGMFVGPLNASCARPITMPRSSPVEGLRRLRPK